MAKFKNKFGIPHQIVSAVMNDPYKGGGDISATQLILPPRILQLRRRHEAEIEMDISDLIWALLGQVGHKILERSDDSHAILEERIGIESLGWLVTGQSDVYVTKDFDVEKGEWIEIPPTIRDYKFIKVIAGKYDHPDWDNQLNILAHLWRSQGFPVDQLEIVAIYRDWSKVLYERDRRRYPPPVQTFKIKLWSPAEADLFIHDRVNLHKTAVELPDELLPFCTPEEQWRSSSKWAVRKPKRESAVKLCDSQEEAEAYIKGFGSPAMTVEFRPAKAMRCEMFCDVRPFCNQFRLENERSEAA